jgi:2-isopropylmalate synthase
VSFTSATGDSDRVEAVVEWHGERRTVRGEGNGPIAAFVHALQDLDLDVRVLDYAEHATGAGEEAQAASYLEVAVGGRVLWGCGVHPSIVTSSLRAIVSAVNRVS